MSFVTKSRRVRNRIWADLSDDEAKTLEQIAAARGCRSSDVLKAALAAFLKAPPDVVQAAAAVPVSPSLDAVLVTRLESLAESMERQTQALQVALNLSYAAEGERNEVREALTDIAMSIGIMAGSIEPVSNDNGGPF